MRARSGLAGLGAMLAFDAILIPPWGLVGASFASLIGYSVAAVICLQAWHARTGEPWRSVLFASRSDLDALRKRSTRSR